MAKKNKFHGIHITPEAGTHYKVRHDPAQEPGEAMSPMMGDSEKHAKLFKHGERADLHAHLDKLMDAHEGVKDSPEEEKEEMPSDHPMHKLKARRMA